MKHVLDVLDTPGDDLHPAVIPRVCDSDIIILLKGGMAVCTLMVYGISDCKESNCILNVHGRCSCMFKVTDGKISILRPNKCTMRLKNVDTIMENL